MPMGSVKLTPGLNIERTYTANQAGYSSTSFIRYRDGLAEKIGGWAKFYPFAVGSTPRALHAWQDFNDVQWLGVGATNLLGAISDGTLTTLTPQTKTTDFAPKFTTSISTTTVTVDDSNIANVTVSDSVEFLTPVSVGGIILSGLYPIDLVTGTTTYHITAATAATSTATNTGTVPAFTTTSGSASVSVALTAHGATAGHQVVFPISTSVGGLTIDGTYVVTSVTNANAFTIAANALATSSTTVSMNSGNAELKYYISLGPISAGTTTYGTGTYGSGGYGTGTTTTAQTGTAISNVTDWSIENWGQTMLSNPEGGGIYFWSPNSGYQTATLISTNGAPVYNNGIVVAMPEQIVMAFGSSAVQDIGVDQDPLLITWSDAGDYSYWTVGTTNPTTNLASQAGFQRLPTGSKIIGALQAPQQTLFWTDLDLWSAVYQGNVDQGFIFAFNKIGSNCGLIGKQARAQLGSFVFWMGANNFFVLGNQGPQPLKCSIRDAVFQDLNTTYAYKARAFSNTPFNEIWFCYCSESGGGTENDMVAKFNIQEQTWDLMPLARSCGIDQSVLGGPIYAAPTGVLYSHEDGYNDDGNAISYSYATGFWSIAEGEDVAFVDWIFPDFKYNTYAGAAATNASIQVTLTSHMYPNDSEARTYGPYTISSTSPYINTRVRGRFLSMQVSGDDLDSFSRLGEIKFRYAPMGRR